MVEKWLSLGHLLRKNFRKSWKHVFYTNWTILSKKQKFLQKKIFGSFKKSTKPRQPYFMILCSSVAQIFRVSSPQVSLSVFKKSFWSDKNFLSCGSFKMVKNRKKRVNQGHSELIFEWTRPSLDLKFGGEIRKRQGFSKMTSVFYFYFSVFYKKLITVKKSIFFIIFEWSRFFPENPAVYCRIVWCPLSLCQISKKFLERLPRTFCDELTNQPTFSLYAPLQWA